MSKRKNKALGITTKVESVWFCEATNTVRILYPSGLVEMFSLHKEIPDDWQQSAFTESTGRKAIGALAEGSKFLGYI